MRDLESELEQVVGDLAISVSDRQDRAYGSKIESAISSMISASNLSASCL